MQRIARAENVENNGPKFPFVKLVTIKIRIWFYVDRAKRPSAVLLVNFCLSHEGSHFAVPKGPRCVAHIGGHGVSPASFDQSA